MTVRPIGKARKRTRPEDRRQTREEMKAVVDAHLEKRARICKEWPDNLAAWAQRIIEDPDGLPAVHVADARQLASQCRRLRQYQAEGRMDDACFEAFEIRGLVEKINNRPLVEIARLETERYVFWRMIPVKLAPKEATICRFMEKRTEADLAEFYRACWGGPFNRIPPCVQGLKGQVDHRCAGFGF